jgi:hypothetical protein
VADRAYVVHRIPGRVRLKVPARRGDAAFFAELSQRVRRMPRVRHVDVNPMTGSVLLRHEGDFAHIASELLGSDAGQLVEMAMALPSVARHVRHEVKDLDQALRRWSHHALDLGTVVAVGLAAMAGLQLLRGRAPSQAVSLAWYSAELLGRWKEPPAALPPAIE